MPSHHRPADLRFPEPGAQAYTLAQREATAALFDAIEADHPVFVGYALEHGAEGRAQAHARQSPKVWQSAQAFAIRTLCERQRTPQNAQALPDSGVVERLLTTDRVALDTLKAFSPAWGGNPRAGFTPLYRWVEARCLSELLHHPTGHPSLDPRGPDQNAARARIPDVPACSWLCVAIEHQRLDVVQHWFAHGGPLVAPEARPGQWSSPLVAAWTNLVCPFVLPTDETGAIVEAVARAWADSPTAAFRQEALALIAACAVWAEGRYPAHGPTGFAPLPMGTRPVFTSRLGAARDSLVRTLADRSMELTVTDEERAALRDVTASALLDTMKSLEQDVLQRSLSTAPVPETRARSRL